MSLKYFAISTLLLALLVLILEVLGVLALPEIGASIERSKRRGDPELRNFDLATWKRMALVDSAIASSLGVAFVISGVGLLGRRRWARLVFVAASFGVLAFMVASCVHYIDFTEILHVVYAFILLVFGWWFLFRSRAGCFVFALGRRTQSSARLSQQRANSALHRTPTAPRVSRELYFSACGWRR